MAIFYYRALQMDGVLADGRIEANGRQDAYHQLEKRGLKPVSLSENGQKTKEETTGFRLEWKRKKVPYREMENFTRLLSSLLEAGIPLSRALKILAKEASAASAREKWKEIHDLVIDGASLADAMAQSPETFPRVYTAMVQAGETGGFLDVVLAQIADFQMREKELRAKMLAAMIYPAVLLTLAIGVLVFLMVFFIPRFQTIFDGFGASLPMLTLAIVAASRAVRTYGLYVAAVLFAIGWATRRWLQSDRGRREWEALLLRLPVIGQLTAQFALARFCRMLGSLAGAGVPLIQALNVSRKSIGNQTLVDAVTASIERVKQGDRLAVSLADCKELFPGSVLEMISVAEETGRLDKELVRLATVTEGELDRRMKTAVALAEPLMLFVIASFIGTIFVGMVIPIFTIQDYIK
ncbi:MAG: type II secretion system F family protein [Candidatus Omnitrophota bacterium]